MRARDIKVGDVIAKDANRYDGWFRVIEVKALADGTINLIDKGNTRSFTTGPFDLVGLQTPVPLPAEAERNVAREQASRAASTSTTPEGAAREAAARGESGGPARALPGA